MKQHLVAKLDQSRRLDAPDWRTFIADKSRQIVSLTPEFDALMRELGLQFWVTREYRLERPEGTPAELAQGLDRTYRVIFQQNYALPADLADRVARLPGFEEARLIEVVEAPLPAPHLATQSSRLAHAGDLIHLAYAKALTRGSPDVTIAVLDTGIDREHPELKGKVSRSKDFVNLEGLDTTDFVGDFLGLDEVAEDEVGHGTHVSGIIAAKGLKMDEGVAPECRLIAVRVLATMQSNGRRYGAGIVDNINAGIKYAVDCGADVINMSLGIRHVGGGLPHEDVIRYALSKGVSVVAASGNDGSPEKYYPGALEGVFAIGATDEAGAVAKFTSWGAPITAVAPGSRIYSAFAKGRYAHASGTSQAAPFVAGAIALLKSFARRSGGHLGHADLVELLRATSDRADGRMRSERAGYGLINLADAFKLLSHRLAGSTMRSAT